ncbi:uncharacterized protein LOC115386278 [Salarias fasciatus]|uniref:uncharacterized protein LOC115386278 n=1 Tax=Salarias fasciatus TaxID=181472 RepID=UPI001176829E|nr:uncharacterized protein LOC115386278 [Salarias fasciatus]
MKLVLSSLLLASLCTPSSWSDSSGTLRVTQSPDVSVQEGGTANISCCWTGGIEGVWVSIKMKPTNMKNNTNSTILLTENHKGNSTNCSDWIIKSASIEDSGIYICKVTVYIPTLIETEGKGTVVTVTPKGGEEKEDGREGSSGSLPVIIGLAVVGPLLLIALTCFFTVLRRKRAQAARLIYETPHVDSDLDKHSTTSSTGSSQWRQVVVYESVDYFQHGQTKESQ